MNQGQNDSKCQRPGVSVICSTNRPNSLDRILENYLRQTYNPRELIIVLNNNSMKLFEWIRKTAPYPDIRVFKLDEQISLGECLNYAIAKARFDYIANFNDDDYYGSPYLAHALAAFTYTDADIVGKGSMYVYFKASKRLVNMWPDRENCYVQAVAGATLVFKKEIFAKVRFPDLNSGEDPHFNFECFRKGYKIYAADRFNYVYIRDENPDNHTWKIREDQLIQCCLFVSYTDDYIIPTTFNGPYTAPDFYISRPR